MHPIFLNYIHILIVAVHFLLTPVRRKYILSAVHDSCIRKPLFHHKHQQSEGLSSHHASLCSGQLLFRKHPTIHRSVLLHRMPPMVLRKKFAILDAGMTDLIRPALYQAFHKMENITSEEPLEAYDVVGPICESSDVFGKAIDLNKVKRGDLIALRSAGAYGEIMASGYNCRELPKGYTSDELV